MIQPRPMLDPLETAVAKAWPPPAWCDAHVVLAVSGGADSVALLRSMFNLKERAGGTGRLYVGHVNHGLRGAAATGDEAWVKRLCARLAIPLEVGSIDVATLAVEEGDGREAAARRARYEFLQGFAERIGARYVAVAHTADDQAETVLHRILRGTGLSGLAGIPFARTLSPSVTLIRPLLGIDRSEVLRYLADLGQDYRTDETNVDRRYTRNRLRHELLPMLRAHYNVEVDKSLRRLAAQAAEAQELIDTVVACFVERCVKFHAAQDSVRIDCKALGEESPLLVREIFRAAWKQAGWPLQAMGFHEWELLADLALRPASVGPLNLPGSVRVERLPDAVLMTRGADRSAATDAC